MNVASAELRITDIHVSVWAFCARMEKLNWRYRLVDPLSVPSGRWLLHTRNRLSSRVVLPRDILFRISLYKSWTPAEVHGTRRAAASSFKWNCVFIYRANCAPLSLIRNRSLYAKTRSRIDATIALKLLYDRIRIRCS